MCHEAKGEYRWGTNHYKSIKLHSIDNTAWMHRRLPICFTKSKGILCDKHKGLRGKILRQINSNVHLFLGNMSGIFIIIFNCWLSQASTFFCMARRPRLSVLLNQETASVPRMLWLESSLSPWVFFCPCVIVLALDWLYLLAFSLLDQLIPSLDWYLAELEHVWSWNKSPIINKYPMEPFRILSRWKISFIIKILWCRWPSSLLMCQMRRMEDTFNKLTSSTQALWR